MTLREVRLLKITEALFSYPFETQWDGITEE